MLLYCTTLLSRLPVAVHYWISDWLLFPLVYHVARYRRKIVAKNLRNSFPEKSEAERQQIARAFYHQFCDLIVEIIYCYGRSNEEMTQRMEIRNLDEAQRYIHTSGGVISMFTHMGNWEWLAAVGDLVDPDVTVAKVYRKLKNKRVDDLMMSLRTKWKGIYVEKQRVLREMVRLKNEKKPVLWGLNSDQKPRPEVTRTWLTFLNQETGFVDGGEVLAAKFNYPVFYGKVLRVKRGYYTVELKLLAANPQELPLGEITRRYAQELEANIKEQPYLWLWSHNRWKWKRPAQ